MKRKPMKRVKMKSYEGWVIVNEFGVPYHGMLTNKEWAQRWVSGSDTVRRVLVTEITPKRRKVK